MRTELTIGMERIKSSQPGKMKSEPGESVFILPKIWSTGRMKVW